MQLLLDSPLGDFHLVGFKILDRYVFKEVLGPSIFCLAVFMITGMIAAFLPLLKDALTRGLTLTVILFQMLINALPNTLVTVLPLSLTIGILLGLGRLASDNEIASMKACGVSVTRLLAPVLALAIIAFGLSLACTLVLIPKGISTGRELMKEALTTRADAAIQERTFFDRFKDVVIYAEQIDPATGKMTNVFIRDERDKDSPTTIVARKGLISSDPKGQSLILSLERGTLMRETRTGDSAGTADFQSSIFRMRLPNADLEAESKSLEESSVAEILAKVKSAQMKIPSLKGQQRNLYDRVQRIGRTLLVQRFVHPAACVALGLMAFPLGILSAGKSRLNNVSLGLAAIFMYYALSLTVERMARSALAPPELVLPIPFLIYVIGAAYFIRCVRLERTPFLVHVFQRAIGSVRR